MTGLFDNASSVVINNKEVQSIVTLTGGVLYEKPSVQRVLTLTSDKDILSYYDSDSCTLTATLTENGVGVQGETVYFDGISSDTPVSKSITANTETRVGSKYVLTNIPNGYTYLDASHEVFIKKDIVDGCVLHVGGFVSNEWLSDFSMENGVITYTDGGTVKTRDVSSYDVSVIQCNASGLTISDYGVSAVTDSNGVATVSYDSKGAGDLNITANCGLVSETYTVEDCINYDAMTSNSGKWTIPSACSTAYDSNGAKFGTATSYSQVKLTDKLTAPCSVEFTLVDYHSDWNDSASVIVYQYTNGETTPNQHLLSGGFYTKAQFSALGTTINRALSKNTKYRIEYGSSTMKVYENGTQLASASNTVGLPTRFEYHIGSGGNRWLKVKDVKIKPL